MQNINSSNLLKNKSLKSLVISKVLSTFSYEMFSIAIGWEMYSITKSALYLGLVGLIQFIPVLLLSLFVGQLSDIYDRKKIVRISQIFQSFFILVLAFFSFKGLLTKETLLILIFFIAIAHSFERPPLQALLPNIVDTDVFPRASALVSSASEFAVILGPCIGGLLYGLNSTAVYGLSGFMFLLSSILMNTVVSKHKQQISNKNGIKDLFAGISFIKAKPIILGAISLDLFAVLFGGATALLPIYANNILKIGSFGLGILRSAPSVGAVLVSYILSKKPIRRNVGMKMFYAVVCFGLSTIVFALSKSVIISFIALVMLGASDVVSVVVRSTLVQLQTPDYMRGRVSSVNMIFVGTSNQLGEFESGLTASLFGTVPAALIGGIGTIAVVLLWRKVFPSLFKVDKFEVAND